MNYNEKKKIENTREKLGKRWKPYNIVNCFENKVKVKYNKNFKWYIFRIKLVQGEDNFYHLRSTKTIQFVYLYNYFNTHLSTPHSFFQTSAKGIYFLNFYSRTVRMNYSIFFIYPSRCVFNVFGRQPHISPWAKDNFSDIAQ